MPTRIAIAVSALVLGLATSVHAGPIVITFDDLPALSNPAQPGNTYDSLGVHISTLNSIPNSVDTVGETFATDPPTDTFWLISNANAVSPPNFAAATGGTTFDVLFSFASPITRLSVLTDDTPEAGETVRLLALRALGGPNYEVLAVAIGLDNAVSSPGNFLQVAVPAGFSYAIFQTTDEQEGFDDLTFVPEPGVLALGAVGIVSLVIRRTRSRGRAGDVRR